MPDRFAGLDRMTLPDDNNDLSEVLRILRKRAGSAAAIATAVFAGVGLSTATKTPEYQSETLILLDNEASTPLVPGAPEIATRKDRSTEIQILQSHSLVAKAISRLEDSTSQLSVSQVVRHLSIRQAGEADVLIVSYTDTDPSRAKAILEALGSTYVDYSLERQLSQATNAIDFIEEQLPKAQAELNETAQAIQKFRQDYGIVDPESYANQVLEQKQLLEKDGQQLEISLSRTQRQYAELRRQMVAAGQNPDTALVNSMLAEDSVYQQLASQLKAVEAKYMEERARFHDTHPVVKNLQMQRDNLFNLLQYRSARVLGDAVSQVDLSDVAGYGAIQQGLATQLLQLETELEAQRSQLQEIRNAQGKVAVQFEQIPQLQQRYADLQREFQVKSQAVNRFLEKLQELQIAEAQETAPWRILEPPYQPQNPISPNIRRNLLLGLIAGGLLGVAAVILLERTDQRLQRVDEAKELTGLPSLGVVPKVKVPLVEGSRMDGDRYRAHGSPFTEAIRSLALNLRYLGAKDEVKTLALTSSTPSEGKSTLTYNLARSLAELGQRVLIVDADMRKPTIHEFIKQTNALGLSSAIATDRPWRNLIQSDRSGNLHVLTSGPMPPNPVALLESQKMRQLLHEWRQAYDYVLIDTPPILGVTDAQSVAANVDRMVLVAAMERSTRSSLVQTMETLRRIQCKLAGLVVNLVDSTHDGYYYHSYYTYYHRTDDEDRGNGNGNGKGNGNGNGHNGHGLNGRTEQILKDLLDRS
ncbi:GumC family protein [Oxynema aestuarii]|uniref:non-specific protein-tyrosine kinase n=1 Tax=Oxynema aestuarii AP17 TaxID=2064643 RepID=A0A6H1U102_9CYAN|nr:polysaccharide biosynthesis tyrosine autokinase [Oxynema aestuarii]QIZ72511.1 polysaccharide biosynthesis tyrosine autokinase [Oxynema aestuarii AP17]